MSSMLCRKETGGQVRVYDGGLMEQLFVDQNDNIRTMMTSKNSRRRITRPNTTPSPVRNHSRNMDSKSLIGQTMKVQQWLSDKTVKTLQEKSDLESREARKLYSPILETENTFVKDVEDFIHQRDVTSLRKKEVLHKNWNERVYKPLRKKIIEAMDSNDWPEVDRRKRELHRQYLEFTNEKGHVFLDTMDPEEYYAMALNGHRPAPIKIETRPLHDPLISQGRQRHEEDRTILRCMTGYRYTDSDIEQVKMPAMPFVPLGRHGTDSMRWLKMPLSNIESTPRQASRRRMVGKFNDTDIDFETWTNTPYNHQAVDRELQIQKKRNYSEDQRPPFPKPVIRRPPPKPVQHSVSFQSPIEQEIPIMAAQPYTMSAPPAVQTVGGD
ncbi:protein FAM228B-like isoform X7 [Mya arenaria]|uniref:protein FAM228B-like isoform X7 n=1 Tax=Mya arenaria TaxID=6604 RepID=UPI0022E8833E|nr:protein FAM228B-like isoform X7 [Mya arenaria]